jgi:hypothetical protein
VGLLAWFVLRRRAHLALPLGRAVVLTAAAVATTALLVALIAGGDAWLYPVRRLVQSLDRGDWSNLTRLYSMQAAWRAFLLSPVVGVGWGQFAFHFPLLVDPLGLQSQFTWPVVNNVPLLVLCETGVGFGRSLVSWRSGEPGRFLATSDLLRAPAVVAAVVAVAQLLTYPVQPAAHLGRAGPLARRSTRKRDAMRRPVVVLDALLLRPQPTGVGRSILELTSALAAEDRGFDFVVLATYPEMLASVAARPGWQVLGCPAAVGGTLRKAALPGRMRPAAAEADLRIACSSAPLRAVPHCRHGP